MTERLQKLLASAGHGSRRGIEEWIRAGRVTINDRVAGLGDRATPADRSVSTVNRSISAEARIGRGAALSQAGGRGDHAQRSGRKAYRVRSLPPPGSGRWIVVGRLDVNTSGLLLFTNDGDLAHRLMHPSSEVRREYLVRLRGSPSAEVLERLRRGVELEDGPANFDAIEVESTEGSHTWIRVSLHEGRNREVRRLFEHEGFVVSRLSRLRYGSVELPPDLRGGAFKLLSPAVVAELAQLAGA